jgi:hypothetical protein
MCDDFTYIVFDVILSVVEGDVSSSTKIVDSMCGVSCVSFDYAQEDKANEK